MKRFAFVFILLSFGIFHLISCGGGGNSEGVNNDLEVLNDTNAFYYEDYFSGELTEDDLLSSGTRYGTKVTFSDLKEGYILEAYLQSFYIDDMDVSLFDPVVLIFDESNGEELGQDDDSGELNSAYLKITIPHDGNYGILITSYDELDLGIWELWFLIRSSDYSDEEYLLFDPATADQSDDSSESDSDEDRCYFHYCGGCDRFDYSTCSCVRRLDCTE